MGKIRDWMHGSGRKTVIAVVIVIAAAIVDRKSTRLNSSHT